MVWAPKERSDDPKRTAFLMKGHPSCMVAPQLTQWQLWRHFEQVIFAKRESKISNASGHDDALPTRSFDTLFTKSFPHILEKIFFSLDYASYKTCMEVKKAWNELLKSESYHKKSKTVFYKGILEDEKKLHRASGRYIQGQKTSLHSDVGCKLHSLKQRGLWLVTILIILASISFRVYTLVRGC